MHPLRAMRQPRCSMQAPSPTPLARHTRTARRHSPPAGLAHRTNRHSGSEPGRPRSASCAVSWRLRAAQSAPLTTCRARPSNKPARPALTGARNPAHPPPGRGAPPTIAQRPTGPRAAPSPATAGQTVPPHASPGHPTHRPPATDHRQVPGHLRRVQNVVKSFDPAFPLL